MGNRSKVSGKARISEREFARLVAARIQQIAARRRLRRRVAAAVAVSVLVSAFVAWIASVAG